MDKDNPTQEDFDKLLRWLDHDRDQAGEKYEKIRKRIISFFSCRGCWDADELTDKTINIVISKIDWLNENYVGNPALYFYGVAKNVYKEWLKKNRPPPMPAPDPTHQELGETCAYLEQCLNQQPPADRDLVLRYQEGEGQEKIQNRKKLARELKITLNALRIRVCHIHSRLRICIEALMGRAKQETP
jgi:DNA-directed RNA polymerase specialized sigma24 family protein